MNARFWGFSFAVLACLYGASFANAQPSTSRFEVGAHASFLRLSDFETTPAGFGGRVSFDLTRWAALEAEADFFPKDDAMFPPSELTPALGIVYRRTRANALFGAKLGWRNDRFGVFGKVRPGFTRLSDSGVECVGDVCALVLLARPEYRTEFALDLGGVFEFYPSARTVARFDLGDTMIRHRSSAPPCWGSNCTSHNLTSRIGVGVRF
jgi:hypothetical protein